MLALSFLREVARHIQSNENRKLIMLFSIHQEKIAATATALSCDAKYSDILQESSHVHFYLCWFCLLYIAMEFKSFPDLRNSKYTKQTDQKNFSCFFICL